VKDNMGWRCSTHGTDKKCVQVSRREVWREEATRETYV